MSREGPTAGEWKADHLNVDAYIDGVPTWLGSAEEGDVPAREAQANARLFAASKDLLAACDDAVFALSDLSPEHPALKGIRAAIAKAKGAS